VSESTAGADREQPDRTGRAGWLSRRARAFGTSLQLSLLIIVPVALYAILLSASWSNFAIDFQQTLLPAAEKLAHGHSPYPAYGYPPLVAFALVPFVFLPAAGVFFVLLLAAGVPLALWLFDVRDWRCYAAAFLWAPTYHAVQTGNVSILLLLGLAVCWRYRERTPIVTIAGGMTIAAKIICWPIAVWLAATRRYRSAVGAVTLSLVLTFGLWALLGFSGLVRYPSDLGRLSDHVSPDSYTLKALAHDLGASTGLSRLLGIVLVVVVLGLCAWEGRRGEDAKSFAYAVAATIVASPIVWLHSFVLLLAVVALFRPRFSAAWLLPASLWFASGNGNGTPWQTALVLLVGAVTFVICVRPGGRVVLRDAPHPAAWAPPAR
jgi:hypothetical protein